MHIERLAELVESPHVQQKLLGDYAGAYSIGVTSDPVNLGRPAIRVRVEDSTHKIPSEIVLDGEAVLVVSHQDFVRPKPLTLRESIA
jgi:hypothetical protein